MVPGAAEHHQKTSRPGMGSRGFGPCWQIEPCRKCSHGDVATANPGVTSHWVINMKHGLIRHSDNNGYTIFGMSLTHNFCKKTRLDILEV